MAALTVWASLRRKRARAEAEQTKDLSPLRERFESEAAPILAKHAPKLAKLDSELAQLEAAIRAAVLEAKGSDGSHRFPRLTLDDAAVEISTRTVREVNPQTFFDLFTPANRDSKFWNCISVLVGKAEKLIGGARLDEIATLKQTHTVTIQERERSTGVK